MKSLLFAVGIVGVVFLLMLGTSPLVEAQLGCTPKTQDQLLNSFSDLASPGSITPQTMRNFVCSTANITGGDVSATVATPDGGSSSLAISQWLPKFDIRAYGAACNGSGDDGPAINLATAALRSKGYGVLVGPVGAICRFTTTLNFTALDPASGGNPYGSVIDLGGTFLDCHVTGDACIDALTSKHLYWKSLLLFGNQGDEPKYGIQNGRSDTSITASQQDFAPGIWIGGYFTGADFINYSSEVNTWTGGYLANSDSGAAAYVFMADCYNHSGLTSHYVTITWTPDTAATCNSISFHGTRMQQGHTAPALWLAGTDNFTFDRTGYVSTGGSYAVVLFPESGGAMSDIVLNEHVETIPTLFSNILISGTQAAPTIAGLQTLDFAAESSFAQVMPDFANGVTSILLPTSNFSIVGVQASVQSTFHVFGQYSGFATATVSTGGSGCTNGSQTFTVSGGLGNAASVTGTVSGNALSGALTVPTAGAYATLPSSTATLTGGGCSVAPTITYTSSTVTPPVTVGGTLTLASTTYLSTPTVFGLYYHVGTGSGESNRFIGTEVYMPNLSGATSSDIPICRTGAKLSAGSAGQICGATASTTPASASAACTTGTIAWDASFVYVCVATNTWKRAGIATW